MNVNGVVDILNALPTSKLISTVSAGIGKIYEPVHIKRIAKAKAEEIKLISGALEECSVIPTQYSNGDLLMNTLDWDDFIRRTQGRINFQELKKQNNIECVVANAYNLLESVTVCSNEPVEDDWVCSFFDFVANVSSEEMQILWGKLLAGEITHPGSCSIRTLDVLRKLSCKEAQTFKRIIPYILKCWGDENKTFKDYFLLSKSLQFIDISFPDIVILNDSGLINANSDISTGFTIHPKEYAVIEGMDKIIKFHNDSDAEFMICNPSFLLTESGKELYDIMHHFDVENPDEDFYNNCIDEIINPVFYDEKEWTNFVTLELIDKTENIE